MSMSTYVVGIKPPDAAWRKMKAVWDACAAAGIDVPREVSKYFNDEHPDEAGVVVDMDKSIAVKRWRADSKDGYEVDLTKLDPTIKILRFVNSY